MLELSPLDRIVALNQELLLLSYRGMNCNAGKLGYTYSDNNDCRRIKT